MTAFVARDEGFDPSDDLVLDQQRRVALVRVGRLSLGALYFPILSMGKRMVHSVTDVLP